MTGEFRPWLRLEGAALFAAAMFAYALAGGGWAMALVLFLAPDLAMLGYLAGPRRGALAYNVAHAMPGPLLLGVVAFAWMPDALPLAALWLAHIGFDRMLGYGLKAASGFKDTHLGRIGPS